jgi:hypothetical protein
MPSNYDLAQAMKRRQQPVVRWMTKRHSLRKFGLIPGAFGGLLQRPNGGDCIMPLENWLAFVAASAIMLAIPGPTILLVISYALGHGRKASTATVTGVALGDFTAMTASMLGLGALLATSAALFTGLKWIGAAYLIYLGIKLWRSPVGVEGGEAAGVTGRERPLKIFLHAYVVTALNPKALSSSSPSCRSFWCRRCLSGRRC